MIAPENGNSKPDIHKYASLTTSVGLLGFGQERDILSLMRVLL